MSKALEALTQEECYLATILMDKSGIDIAEFLWYAPENEDLCFRAWPFQWGWWRHRDPMQIDQSSRSCGKSESIKVRLFAFPFLFPNQEALITAPELNHLEPIIKKLEGQFDRTRLSKFMLKRPPTHRPFYVEFVNGSRILGAIPQKTGVGVKGKHPVWLEQDEASDYPENGWTELVETLNRSNPDATWRAHGVTRGVRDSFYENSKHSMDEAALRPVSHAAEGKWTVHKIPAMARPTWTDEERQEKIQQYGSKDDPDYRRNVLGAHGDAQSPIFVMRRLMKCVDDDVSSEYNTEEYWHYKVKDTELEGSGQGIDELITPPYDHKKYKAVWMGMDVGFCVDTETEIFTRRGWLNWDEVKEGDETLAINPDTGASEWSPITGIYREAFESVPMVKIQGQAFSAMTTPHHRWLTCNGSGNWKWEQTRTLKSKQRIPLAAPRADQTATKTYSDDFVRLVAWYWTEGWICPGGGIGLSQSNRRYPENVLGLDRLFGSLYGEPGPIHSGPRVSDDRYDEAMSLVANGDSSYRIEKSTGVSAWTINRWRNGGVRKSARWSRAHRREGMVEYRLNKWDSAEVTAVTTGGSEKVIRMEFLTALTLDQLRIFIDVSIAADGWMGPGGHMKIEQRSEKRIRAFEQACILAGLPVSTCYDPTRDRWLACIKASPWVDVVSAARTTGRMSIEAVDYDGVIWCPQVEGHKNWLARRNGSIYFTGNTIDPSEILIAAEYPLTAEEKAKQAPGKAVPKDGASRLKIIGRVTLNRISEPDQADAIMALIDFYHPKVFAMDSTGAGLPLFQGLQRRMNDVADTLRSKRAREAAESIKGYNFSSKILVEIDETADLDDGLSVQDIAREAGISRLVIEYSTDVLRTYVDEGRLWMPFDTELVGEFQGQTFRYAKGQMDGYGRRRIFSQGGFHALDAARMLALGHKQYAIEALMATKDERPPVLDAFIPTMEHGGSSDVAIW